MKNIPDSKVLVAHLGPTWVLSAPGGPHVGPMNLAITDIVSELPRSSVELSWLVMFVWSPAKSRCYGFCGTWRVLGVRNESGKWRMAGRYVHDDVIKWKRVLRYRPLCGEFTGQRLIPSTKASDAELWCFLWSAPWINGWVNNGETGDWSRHCAHNDIEIV